MATMHSKTAFLYRQIKRDLQAGRYLPGQRIDPATIAGKFNTSPTPVRFALYRLVGEGLITDHARAGLHLPLPTEVALRDLYDWMECLLLMACDAKSGAAGDTSPPHPESDVGTEDAVKYTWQLFDAIARSTTRPYLQQAIKLANDRLSPVRRAKQHLIDHVQDEVAVLADYWNHGQLNELRTALRAYWDRRKGMVPRVVAELNQRLEQDR